MSEATINYSNLYPYSCFVQPQPPSTPTIDVSDPYHLPKAFIMDDPDANGFVHWVVYNIPGQVTQLPSTLTTEGKNSRNQTGFTPFCPPSNTGEHHYRFRIFLLDPSAPLLPQNLAAPQVLDALTPYIWHINEGILGAFSAALAV